MGAFPTSVTIATTNVDAAGDSPASARAEIKSAFDQLNSITASYDDASGIAALDASGLIVNTKLPNTLISSSGNNLTLDPHTSMVKIQNFFNLVPVAYGSLPASEAAGDVAFLTNDGAGAAKNKLIYSTGSGWKYVFDDSTVAAS